MKDPIERQAAIDVLKGLPTWWADEGGYYGGAQPPMVALLDPEDAVSAIENLPSAQPEIVMCKDCKHRIEHKHYGDLGESAYTCEGNMDGWILPDDYCSKAERRTDEQAVSE